jgi:hypothetical protein
MVSAVIVGIVRRDSRQGRQSALKAALACLIKTLCCLYGRVWATAKQPLLLLMDFTMVTTRKKCGRSLRRCGDNTPLRSTGSATCQQRGSCKVRETFLRSSLSLSYLLALVPCPVVHHARTRLSISSLADHTSSCYPSDGCLIPTVKRDCPSGHHGENPPCDSLRPCCAIQVLTGFPNFACIAPSLDTGITITNLA